MADISPEKKEAIDILEVKNISKVFPGVKALDQVSLSLKKGEVLALLGENGAGKSTLMKVLAGVYIPDSGEMIYQGKPITWKNPMDAKKQGIVLIHQEISLVSELTVAENIFLGSFPNKKLGRIDFHKLYSDARAILDQLNCDFSETTLVGELSIAKQQMVEIARALAFQPNVVIFDEPTASLTDAEKDVLFENIRRLKQKGVGMIYISHKMNEIFEISDRITVLRDGKVTGTKKTADTNEAEVTQLMIGRTLEEYYSEKSIHQFGKEILRVENLTVKRLFANISFSVRQGEVLGLYGLVGAGRSEVAETIFGIRKKDSGKIFIEEVERNIPDSNVAVNLGIALVPENRKLQGLVLGMGGKDNMTLAHLKSLKRFGFIQTKKELDIFADFKQKFSISITGPRQPVVNLSGGNQQKVVIAKWLSIHPKLLILDEPTRGIDVGSKSEIHKLIRRLAEEGYAVLVISSEMPEIMGVSDRIITMYQGKQTGEFTGMEVTEDSLIQAITKVSA
ncbi:sugar ABC transporter ATP-binding protein [Fodinisporobacter ferrooxydans]|uniref:Sugar ABC transporter ATP-binding protein n=1 Tax=Fodinisporobacter ferrooxydans TaxID=2901836 RepID=A0ABY4CKU6_9BACL|nr:sugar ABC transporter ATP-binding protein [Alicyclobacillaceae bacterium MYW30-H2]